MRIIRREDGIFLESDSREELSAFEILQLVRAGQDVRVESDATGEDVTGKALLEAIRHAGPGEDFFAAFGRSVQDLKDSVSSRAGEAEDGLKELLQGFLEKTGNVSSEPDWFEEIEQDEGSFSKIENKMMEFVRRALDKLGVPDKEEIEQLKQRVEKLEKDLPRH